MNAQEAYTHLVDVLDLHDMADGQPATWADIVTYTAKAKAAGRMANAAVRRRTAALRDVLAAPETATYPELLAMVEKKAQSQALAERVEQGLIRWLDYRGIHAVSASWEAEWDQEIGASVTVYYRTPTGGQGSTVTYQSFSSLVDEIDHVDGLPR